MLFLVDFLAVMMGAFKDNLAKEGRWKDEEVKNGPTVSERETSLRVLL